MITKLKLTDFDIFAKTIGNYYNLKEKISSNLSLVLTCTYIISSLMLLFIYVIKVIRRADYRVFESAYFSEKVPEIKINNDLLYFAFGVEDPITTNTFIDESIYNIKVEYLDIIRKNGIWSAIDQKSLSISKCNEKNFGLGYEKYFKNKHLNNSYCIDDINLTLAGGFSYDRLAYIIIKVYPCVNKTENNFKCKSQEEIDYYLSNGYFSILTKDKGLNPSDYNNPITPVFKDLYFTIGKYFLNQYILKFDITEIQTDRGLFFNNIHTEKFLKFNNEEQNINIRGQNEYYKGYKIAEIQIRLNDSIRIQKRSYLKMTDILSTIGGYMQFINIIFSLISLIPNKLNSEKIIVDSLFNFDLKNKKVIITLKYKNSLNYYPEIKYISSNNCINKTFLFKKNLRNPFSSHNSFNIINSCKNIQSTFLHNRINHINRELSDINEIINKSDLIINKKNDDIIYENPNKVDDNSKEIFCPNVIRYHSQINSKNKFKTKKKITESHLMINSKKIINHSSIKIPFKKKYSNNIKINRNLTLMLKKQSNEEGIIKHVKFNFFEYLCFQKSIKNNLNIILFDEASSFYKNQMDIINRFGMILLMKENIKKENKHVLDNMLSEKIEFQFPSGLGDIYINE